MTSFSPQRTQVSLSRQVVNFSGAWLINLLALAWIGAEVTKYIMMMMWAQ